MGVQVVIGAPAGYAERMIVEAQADGIVTHTGHMISTIIGTVEPQSGAGGS